MLHIYIYIYININIYIYDISTLRLKYLMERLLEYEVNLLAVHEVTRAEICANVEFTYLEIFFSSVFRLRLPENKKLRLISVSRRQEIIGEWSIHTVVF